jgi:hypothetical protein
MFSATTGKSLITPHLVPSFSYTTCSCGCRVLTFPQNGKVERMIRTTTDIIRTLMFHVSLPARYWAEGLDTTTLLLNCLHTKAISAPLPPFWGLPLL